MIRANNKRVLVAKAGVGGLLFVAALLAGMALWSARLRTSGPARPAGVYTAKRLGGFARFGSSAASKNHSADTLQAAVDAYEQGQYQRAEAEAQKIIDKAKGAPLGSKAFRKALQARQLSAYSAARRKDIQLAQARFAELRDRASELPDHGRQPAEPGERLPALEEEAAYQLAVCTGVLEGPKAAEAEFCRFLRAYPQSILVSGAIQRIARYHKGTIPRQAETLWRQAMQVQKQSDQRQQREASLCGPECLAELLKRQGRKMDMRALAEAMGITEQGVSMAALSQVAKRYGYHPRGLQLSEQGLLKQKLPVIAYANWGHYLIVEAASPQSVQVWDPDALGLHHGGRKRYSQQQWQQVWAGYTLALR